MIFGVIFHLALPFDNHNKISWIPFFFFPRHFFPLPDFVQAGNTRFGLVYNSKCTLREPPSCLAVSLASQRALTCSFIHPSPPALRALPSSPYPPPVSLAQLNWPSRQPSVFLCNPPPSHLLSSPLSLGLSRCLSVFLLTCSLCFCLSDGNAWCTFLVLFLCRLIPLPQRKIEFQRGTHQVLWNCSGEMLFVSIQGSLRSQSLLWRNCNISQVLHYPDNCNSRFYQRAFAILVNLYIGSSFFCWAQKIILKLFYINALMHPSADTEVDWNLLLTWVVSLRPQSLKLLGFMCH